MAHECQYKDDISEIKKDVKSLLRFKWQIMGGAGVIGVLLAALINILN